MHMYWLSNICQWQNKQQKDIYFYFIYMYIFGHFLSSNIRLKNV